jgi:glycyl-tRNA synthetase beta chain
MVKKTSDNTGGSETLLIELLTEELPPKVLQRMSRAFCDALVGDLRHDSLLAEDSQAKVFATPRRLAVSISDVLTKAPDKAVEIPGPSIKVGLDSTGKPTPALTGFARKNGVTVDELVQIDTPKGKLFACRKVATGTHLEANLQSKVEEALKRLPVTKKMRWGSGEAEFARPVHGLVMLHGSRVVPGKVLGAESSNNTLGHRFLAGNEVPLKRADDYEDALRDTGKVIADFAGRRSEISQLLEKAAGGAELVVNDALLDEVTAIVEAPVVYAGAFSPDFLTVPEECLILSMQQHQKYVPLRDRATGKLLPRFLFVSNIPAKDPGEIIHGNERVLRARLSDAKFFYDQDRKTRLDARVPRLAKVVYVNKLGSQLDRVERVKKLAGLIARELRADVAAAERAAYLSKADLLTEMVGEFPELQGTMGRYYAMHDGEPEKVSAALEQHYWPRFAGDKLPESPSACAVALADKLDTIAGMFGVGQQPTGDKDPFGLRRAALGIVRIVVEKRLPVLSNTLVDLAFQVQPPAATLDAGTDLIGFLNERLRGYLRDQGHSAQEVDTVLSAGTARLAEVLAVLEAVKKFQQLPEAADLAAANKRIVNIIRKAGVDRANADVNALVEPAERALFEALQGLKPEVESKFQSHDYTGALQVLARLKKPVDTFFDKVMVMTDDARVRDNRLALLGDLKALMNRVADISKLAA